MSRIFEELRPLFEPRSVAVIGATNNVGKWGYSSLVSILNSYSGDIYPVNLSESTVLERTAYPRVTDIPGEVDLAVFVIPSSSVAGAMEDCVEKGVKAALIISAGFAEIGEEGKALQDEVVTIAREGGIRIVGPNCMGFWSAASPLRAFMFPLPVLPGHLGFVSQGGNLGGAVVYSAFMRGVGFHKYVSCGCAADLQIEDYIEYFADDPDIKVIMAYIEGLNDGRRFLQKVKDVTSRKPVIAMKPGRTEAAAHAIVSHSGALSGSDSIFEAACTEAGVIRADSGEELLDIAVGFLTQPLPHNRNVAVVTPGGSYGVVCADACASNGLNVLELSEETVAEFDKLFPPRWSHGNPVDPAGDRNFISYLKAPAMLLELEDVGSLIFMGYGSFSAFTTGVSFLETEEEGRMFSSMIPDANVIESWLRSLLAAIESGDREQLEGLFMPVLSLVSSLLGADAKEDADQFVQKVTHFFSSGGIEFSTEDYDSISVSLEENGPLETARNVMANTVDQLLTALIVDWIVTYDKPVFTTTFSEAVPHMSKGTHLSYPSGERAAKVLAGMVRFREYLEREGVWETGDVDPFSFTLLEESPKKEEA